MKPVNLLPSGYRPRVQGEGSGNASMLLGALGLLLVLMLGYVFVSNRAASQHSKAAALNQEAQLSEARLTALKPYQQFADLKRTRETSVTELAQSRFDWERTIRELSRLLPAHVFLSTLDASTTPEDNTSGTASTADSSTSTGPSMKLMGCAPNQPAVAATLVRLRALYSAADVTLDDSTKGGESGATTPAPAAGAGDAGACSDYTFNVTVTFNPGGLATAQPTPASSGSGK